MDIDKIESIQQVQKDTADNKNRKGATSPTENNYPNSNSKD